MIFNAQNCRRLTEENTDCREDRSLDGAFRPYVVHPPHTANVHYETEGKNSKVGEHGGASVLVVTRSFPIHTVGKLTGG